MEIAWQVFMNQFCFVSYNNLFNLNIIAWVELKLLTVYQEKF